MQIGVLSLFLRRYPLSWPNQVLYQVGQSMVVTNAILSGCPQLQSEPLTVSGTGPVPGVWPDWERLAPC